MNDDVSPKHANNCVSDAEITSLTDRLSFVSNALVVLVCLFVLFIVFRLFVLWAPLKRSVFGLTGQPPSPVTETASTPGVAPVPETASTPGAAPVPETASTPGAAPVPAVQDVPVPEDVQTLEAASVQTNPEFVMDVRLDEYEQRLRAFLVKNHKNFMV